MTNAQFVLAATAVAVPTLIPTIAVVISILRSDAAINELRTQVRSDLVDLRSEIHGDIRAIHGDIRALHGDIEGLRDNLSADIRILNTLAYEHHGRLTSLEKKP